MSGFPLRTPQVSKLSWDGFLGLAGMQAELKIR